MPFFEEFAYNTICTYNIVIVTMGIFRLLFRTCLGLNEYKFHILIWMFEPFLVKSLNSKLLSFYPSYLSYLIKIPFTGFHNQTHTNLFNFYNKVFIFSARHCICWTYSNLTELLKSFLIRGNLFSWPVQPARLQGSSSFLKCLQTTIFLTIYKL